LKSTVQLQQSIGALGEGALTANSFNLEPAVRDGYNECRQAYKSWCKEFGRNEEPLRFATFASNYFAMKQYAAQTGDTLKLNQYADCTKEEVARIMNNAASENNAMPQEPVKETQPPKIESSAPAMDSTTKTTPAPASSQEGPRRGVSALGTGYNPGGEASTAPPAKSYNPFGKKPGTPAGTVVVKRGDDDRRGTMVIKRRISEPGKDTYNLGSLFTGNKPSGSITDSQSFSDNAGTDDLASSVMSLFGGIGKTALGFGSRTVTGSIQIPTFGGKEDSERSTIHIQNLDENGFIPSIISFFGGAQENTNQGKRPTIAIKAQAYWNQFMNFVEERDKKATMQEAEYLAAMQARYGDQGTTSPEVPKVEFRSTRTLESVDPTVPELRQWQQNEDGSITGYIFNSSFYKDGSQLTTSPVPYNVTGNSVVETLSGSKYSLGN
jgi:hypothetical protein